MCGYYAYNGKEKEEKMKYIITSETVQVTGFGKRETI